MNSQQQRQTYLQNPENSHGLDYFLLWHNIILIFRNADTYCFPYLYAKSILVVSKKSTEAKTFEECFSLVKAK